MTKWDRLPVMATVMLCLVVVGCSVEDSGTDGGDVGGAGTDATSGAALSGTVMIDGSSTVFPISQACAEEFGKLHGDVKVVVGTSGTGGGFKKFVLGETDINDASRPIKQQEIDACQENDIEFLELTVAIDGLSVMVNPQNEFVSALTTEQLKKIWAPDSTVELWSDVDPAWPRKEIKLYGPDTDSGTFDYFTEVICGEGGASRSDYTPSTDDNVLVKGIAGDKYSLGYFGYAYYVENKDKLKAVGIAEGSDASRAVVPEAKSIEDGKYTPLSRPLFLYVNKASLAKPHVRAFLEFYLREGQKLVGEVGYVKLSADALAATRAKLAK